MLLRRSHILVNVKSLHSNIRWDIGSLKTHFTSIVQTYQMVVSCHLTFLLWALDQKSTSPLTASLAHLDSATQSMHGQNLLPLNVRVFIRAPLVFWRLFSKPFGLLSKSFSGFPFSFIVPVFWVVYFRDSLKSLSEYNSIFYSLPRIPSHSLFWNCSFCLSLQNIYIMFIFRFKKQQILKGEHFPGWFKSF